MSDERRLMPATEPIAASGGSWNPLPAGMEGMGNKFPAHNASGSKYLRKVPCIKEGYIDVYAVLDAFRVTCPACQHAIKKLLCAGLRGKGDAIQDLKEARDAISRAIEMEVQKTGEEKVPCL